MTYIQYRHRFPDLAAKHRDERLALELEHNAHALRVCGRRLAVAAQNRMRFPTHEPAEVCEAAIEILREWDTAHGLNQTRVLQDGHIVTIPIAK